MKITVHRDDLFPPSVTQTGEESEMLTDVTFQHNYHNPRIAPRQLLQDHERLLRTGIVHIDHLTLKAKIREGAAQLFMQFLESASILVDRDDDAHQ